MRRQSNAPVETPADVDATRPTTELGGILGLLLSLATSPLARLGG